MRSSKKGQQKRDPNEVISAPHSKDLASSRQPKKIPPTVRGVDSGDHTEPPSVNSGKGGEVEYDEDGPLLRKKNNNKPKAVDEDTKAQRSSTTTPDSRRRQQSFAQYSPRSSASSGRLKLDPPETGRAVSEFMLDEENEEELERTCPEAATGPFYAPNLEAERDKTLLRRSTTGSDPETSHDATSVAVVREGHVQPFLLHLPTLAQYLNHDLEPFVCLEA